MKNLLKRLFGLTNVEEYPPDYGDYEKDCEFVKEQLVNLPEETEEKLDMCDEASFVEACATQKLIGILERYQEKTNESREEITFENVTPADEKKDYLWKVALQNGLLMVWQPDFTLVYPMFDASWRGAIPVTFWPVEMQSEYKEKPTIKIPTLLSVFTDWRTGVEPTLKQLSPSSYPSVVVWDRGFFRNRNVAIAVLRFLQTQGVQWIVTFRRTDDLGMEIIILTPSGEVIRRNFLSPDLCINIAEVDTSYLRTDQREDDAWLFDRLDATLWLPPPIKKEVFLECVNPVTQKPSPEKLVKWQNSMDRPELTPQEVLGKMEQYEFFLDEQASQPGLFRRFLEFVENSFNEPDFLALLMVFVGISLEYASLTHLMPGVKLREVSQLGIVLVSALFGWFPGLPRANPNITPGFAGQEQGREVRVAPARVPRSPRSPKQNQPSPKRNMPSPKQNTRVTRTTAGSDNTNKLNSTKKPSVLCPGNVAELSNYVLRQNTPSVAEDPAVVFIENPVIGGSIPGEVWDSKGESTVGNSTEKAYRRVDAARRGDSILQTTTDYFGELPPGGKGPFKRAIPDSVLYATPADAELQPGQTRVNVRSLAEMSYTVDQDRMNDPRLMNGIAALLRSPTNPRFTLHVQKKTPGGVIIREESYKVSATKDQLMEFCEGQYQYVTGLPGVRRSTTHAKLIESVVDGMKQAGKKISWGESERLSDVLGVPQNQKGLNGIDPTKNVELVYDDKPLLEARGGAYILRLDQEKYDEQNRVSGAMPLLLTSGKSATSATFARGLKTEVQGLGWRTGQVKKQGIPQEVLQVAPPMEMTASILNPSFGDLREVPVRASRTVNVTETYDVPTAVVDVPPAPPADGRWGGW